jgi:diguanylate cyclase (GGDEF)-like protein
MPRLGAPARRHLRSAEHCADHADEPAVLTAGADRRLLRARLLVLALVCLVQPALSGAAWRWAQGPAAATGPAVTSTASAMAWSVGGAALCTALALWLIVLLAQDAGVLALQASRGRRALRQMVVRTRERDLALRERDLALREGARLDDLTGLASRAAFISALHDAVAASVRAHAPLTVMFIDLDDFKQVNDRHGHAAGDALLRAFAGRLQAGIRGSDLAARIGGDEFAVLAQGLDVAGAIAMASALTDKLVHPYALGGIDVRVSASIGLAGCPDQGLDAMALLRAADAAMYRAKRAGKAGFMTADSADVGHTCPNIRHGLNDAA